MIYNYNETFDAACAYFKGDDFAAHNWVKKYAMKDSSGNIYEKTPDDMHIRLAKEIARIEQKYQNPISEDIIFNLLKDFKYIIPQGGPMSGIGNNMYISSIGNCFVIGNDADSYGGILRTDEEQVQLMKRRGGVGHDLSHIRPSGTAVNNSALTSTGAVSFMDRYSNSTREVAQDGRRGALMLSISIKHPDAESFIDAKLAEGKVTGANISVKIIDEFMECVQNGTLFTQQYPIDSDNPIITKQIDAKKLWYKIVNNAWKSAEPGILFWDKIIAESPADCYSKFGFKTTTTNPCGELPLAPYDSCRLLAINLYSYVIKPFTSESYFDFDLFKEHCIIAQRIMDDIIDLELEKINAILSKIESDVESDDIKRTERELWLKIKTKCQQGRRSGVGITAEGDMLAALNLTYASDSAIEHSVNVHKQMAINLYMSSVILAKERGCFDLFSNKLEKDNPFLNRLKDESPELKEMMEQYGRRNIALLTIAPTGTTSTMCQTTSGIEPAFSVYYKRRKKISKDDTNAQITFVDKDGDTWGEYIIFHHKFLEWAKINGYNIEDIQKYNDSELEELVKLSPYYKSTSNDIDWVNKVKMQGEIQKWIDHSISVTVNLPNSVTVETVNDVYITAHKFGCKGVTVYRDGSRSGVMVSVNDSTSKSESEYTENNAPKRPKVIDCDIIRFVNNKEKWIGFIGIYKNRPYEMFTGKLDAFPIPSYVKIGKIRRTKDSDNTSRYDLLYIDSDGYEQESRGLDRVFDKNYWNLAKMISGVLRHGMPIIHVQEMIKSLKFDGDGFGTWQNGVLRMFKNYIADGSIVKGDDCPKCGSQLVYQEGCLSCKQCGYGKCG
jgi:ribonucleoside-diphosphate reductase alpha chain